MESNQQSEQVEQLKQVLGYLRGSKEEALGALDIVLPYSGTDETRQLFATTDACKELLRLLPEQGGGLVTLNALKCLINFS